MKFFVFLAVFIALAVVSNAFHLPKIHRVAVTRRNRVLNAEEDSLHSLPVVESAVEDAVGTAEVSKAAKAAKKGGKMWDMSKCVYFGNLPTTANEEKVKNFIYNYIGPERLDSIKLIVDKRTGNSKGYAYINFKEAEDASASIHTLSELNFEGNPVKVTSRVVRTDEEVKKDFGSLPRVYIANLEWGMDESSLIQLIEEKLELTKIVKYVKIGRDDFGRSKGYAHIELSTSEQVETLIERLNGFHGGFKPLVVERAGSTGRKSSGRTQNTSANTNEPNHTSSSIERPKKRSFENKESVNPRYTSIFLGNLSWSVSKELLDEMLTDVLGPNNYVSVRLAQDTSTGNHRGFAHIDFKDQESAERAISELNGMELLNRVLRADRADTRSGSFRKRDSPASEQVQHA